MTTLSRALLIAALSAPLAASAQDAPTGSSPMHPSKASGPSKVSGAEKPEAAEKEKLSQKDLQIIAHYHQDNQMEIELGNLAKKRGTSQAIKSYGQMLVDDHRAFDKDLMALVKKRGQKLPAHKAANEAEKQELADIEKAAADVKKLTGARFDRAYLNLMVTDHHGVLQKIDAHIAEVENLELADMLRDVKPKLQQHHDQARELQQDEPQARR